jgi:hypothetical protein
MEIDTKLIRLLMEVGYLAGGHGFFKESETIFEGLKAVRSESEYPIIGLAITKMNAKKNDEAVEILREQALKLNPDSDMAKCFLGLSLKLSGMNHESRKVLEDVVENGNSEEAVNMARSFLETS